MCHVVLTKNVRKNDGQKKKEKKDIRRILLPPPTIFLLVVEGMDRLTPPSRRQESTTVTTIINNQHHATTTTGTSGGRGGGQDGIGCNARVFVVDLRDLVDGLFLVSFSLNSLSLIATATAGAPTTAAVRRWLTRDGKRVNVAEVGTVISLHLLLKVTRLRLRLGLGVVVGRCRSGRSRAPNGSFTIITAAMDMLRVKVVALMIIVRVLRSLLPRGGTPPWCWRRLDGRRHGGQVEGTLGSLPGMCVGQLVCLWTVVDVHGRCCWSYCCGRGRVDRGRSSKVDAVARGGVGSRGGGWRGEGRSRRSWGAIKGRVGGACCRADRARTSMLCGLGVVVLVVVKIVCMSMAACCRGCRWERGTNRGCSGVVVVQNSGMFGLLEFALNALVLDPVPNPLVLVFPAVCAKYLIEERHVSVLWYEEERVW